MYGVIIITPHAPQHCPYKVCSGTLVYEQDEKIPETRLHRLNFCRPKNMTFCSLWESCKTIPVMSKHFLLNLAESGI